MTADLHIHTTASDGRFSPLNIIEQATQAELSYIGITDHDTVDGLLQLHEMQDTLPPGLSIISGIELSTDLPDNEVHILGYCIDIFNVELRRQLKTLIAHRHDRAQQMINKLNHLGYSITYRQVLTLAGHATAIGRPHIAQALVENEYFASIAEVFDTLLAKGGAAYVPHYKFTPKQVIQLIITAGGIPVLAHPGLVGNDELVLQIISSGVLGLEVYHPKHTQEQIQKYLRLAQEHQLAITGGSDFHGIPTRFPQRIGLFTIPAILASQLQKARKA